jgi:hypothetical protein
MMVLSEGGCGRKENSGLQPRTGGRHPAAHAQSPRTTILGSRASLLTSLAHSPSHYQGHDTYFRWCPVLEGPPGGWAINTTEMPVTAVDPTPDFQGLDIDYRPGLHRPTHALCAVLRPTTPTTPLSPITTLSLLPQIYRYTTQPSEPSESP